MKQEISKQREAELTEAILRFLAEQSDTVTLEKIVEWWIARQPVHININAVTRAVNRLSEQGLLEWSGEGKSRRYQLKRCGPDDKQ
jgi:Fe2+ or Zn2+ uptake regulation protein